MKCLIEPENRELIGSALLLAVLVVEYWLGKTDKVQAASILEIAKNLLIGKPVSVMKPEEKQEQGEKNE